MARFRQAVRDHAFQAGRLFDRRWWRGHLDGLGWFFHDGCRCRCRCRLGCRSRHRCRCCRRYWRGFVRSRGRCRGKIGRRGAIERRVADGKRLLGGRRRLFQRGQGWSGFGCRCSRLAGQEIVSARTAQQHHRGDGCGDQFHAVAARLAANRRVGNAVCHGCGRGFWFRCRHGIGTALFQHGRWRRRDRRRDGNGNRFRDSFRDHFCHRHGLRNEHTHWFRNRLRNRLKNRLKKRCRRRHRRHGKAERALGAELGIGLAIMAALAARFARQRGGGRSGGKRRAAGRAEFCARLILGLAGKAFQLASLFI